MNELSLPIAEQAQGVLPYAQNYNQGDGGLGVFLSGILSVLLVLGTLMVFFYLVLGAIEWITSGGDKGKTEKARDKMTQSIIGIIVLVSVLAIMSLVQTFLGLEVFNFQLNSNNSRQVEYRTSGNMNANPALPQGAGPN